jgi:hypothetical protein
MSKRQGILLVVATALGIAGLMGTVWHWYHPSCTPSVQTYLKLLEIIPPLHPGRGLSDYPGTPLADIPKSYAMILAGEVNRLRAGGMPERDSTIAENAGQWLLDHCDEDRDGLTGWGLPFAWDAYGDGTTNPANTEYTITTGIVINALLDWVDYDFKAPKGRIVTTVSGALAPYLNSQFTSPSGLFSYSLDPNDLHYDCFNPSAYLAGQMQRFSHYVNDRRMQTKLRQAADRVINLLLRYKKIDSNDAWYWSYSIQEEAVPNDLPHAAYIIDGIRNYMTHGGRLSSDIDWDSVYRHLQSFSSKDYSRWHAFPVFSNIDPDRPPRLYDLGMALYLFSRCDASAERAKSFASTICSYRSDGGHYLKWPLSSKLGRVSGNKLPIQEYEAYLLMGLSHYCFPNKAPEIRLVASGVEIETGFTRVPLTFYETPTFKAELFFHADRLTGILRVNGNYNVMLPPRTLPLKLLDWRPGLGILISRELWSGRLQCHAIHNGKTVLDAIALPDDLGGLLFRQAITYKTRFVVIAYDSIHNQNILFDLSFSEPEKRFLLRNSGRQVLLLSAELGYEQQPHILAGIQHDTLFLAGGPSIYSLHPDPVSGVLVLSRLFFSKDWRALELHVSASNAGVLCQTPEEDKRFCILDLHTKKVVRAFHGELIPFHLVDDSGQWSVRFVQTPADLEALFLLDMKNSASSGLMSAGLNNYEGEVVWSQSYYLNGFTDFLDSSLYPFPDHALLRLRSDVARRLDFEMALLDKLSMEGPGILCKVFSTNREPSRFAVQSGKILLLLKRYRTVTQDGVALQSFNTFLKDTVLLRGHREVLTQSKPGDPDLEEGRHYLMWPKGIPFPYDGVGIPYNHQNCWAAGVLYKADQYLVPQERLNAATDIADLFLKLEGFRGNPPKHDRSFAESNDYFLWYYWWGKAKAGWDSRQGISINTPTWRGDGKNVALPRYRTFDAIAVLCAEKRYKDFVDDSLLSYFADAVERDGLELFLLPYLAAFEKRPFIRKSQAIKCLRIDSQPDFRNSMIAYRVVTNIFSSKAE